MAENNTDSIENPLFKLALVALRRASKNAREQAIIHNTQLIIWKDNRVVKLSPREIREQSVEYRVEK